MSRFYNCRNIKCKYGLILPTLEIPGVEIATNNDLQTIIASGSPNQNIPVCDPLQCEGDTILPAIELHLPGVPV